MPHARLAADVPVRRIGEIVNGAHFISVDTAMRLGLYFDMEAGFCLNLQAEYDVRMAEAHLLAGLKKGVRRLPSPPG